MRLIIEARIEGDDFDPTDGPIPLAVIDRRDDDLEQLGLSLAEGRVSVYLQSVTFEHSFVTNSTFIASSA